MLVGGGGMAPGVGGRLPPAGTGASIPRRPASAGTLPTAVRAALRTSSFGSVGEGGVGSVMPLRCPNGREELLGDRQHRTDGQLRPTLGACLDVLRFERGAHRRDPALDHLLGNRHLLRGELGEDGLTMLVTD